VAAAFEMLSDPESWLTLVRLLMVLGARVVVVLVVLLVILQRRRQTG
tara:strand:+ start:199 stop:339 length:141 start_codon:yes stop_codon:yes gene_type:complete